MKNFRFLLLLPILLISSCGDRYITERVTEQVIMNTATRYYNVSARDWILVEDRWGDPKDSKGTFFYVDFAEPLLTNWQMNNGTMNAYLSTMDGSLEVLTPLPYDDFYRERSSPDMWTEQATCEYSVQNVRFIVKYNDFGIGIRPLPYTFMVRYAW